MLRFRHVTNCDMLFGNHQRHLLSYKTVTEQPPKPTSEDPGSMRSPIRPSRPETDFPERPPLVTAPATETESQMKTPLPQNPNDALEALRQKMEIAASEFSQGK